MPTFAGTYEAPYVASVSRNDQSVDADRAAAGQSRNAAQEMRAFLEAREVARAERALARRTSVEAVLPHLVAILEAHGAHRIWVFGSFKTGPFDEHSDLDLATEGLHHDAYFAARAALSERCPVSFDLVELERAPTVLRTEILEHGQLLGKTTRTTT